MTKRRKRPIKVTHAAPAAQSAALQPRTTPGGYIKLTVRHGEPEDLATPPTEVSLEGSTLTLGENVRAPFVLSSDSLGAPGLPWSGGTLKLEHHPKLKPPTGRGLGRRIGEYWKLRGMPQVQSAVDQATASLTARPYELEDAKLPPWAKDSVEAGIAAERQRKYAQRVFWAWTRTGAERSLDEWIGDVVLFTFICGFYLGEIIAQDVLWDLGGGKRVYRCPSLPELRAPWSVRRWVLQDEKPLWVEQTLSQTLNYVGGVKSKTGIVRLPWEKVVHIPLSPAGPSDLEGRPLLRGAWTPLRMIQTCYQLQAMGVELNALGVWVVTDSATTPMSEPHAQRLDNHFKNFKAEHSAWMRLPAGVTAELVTSSATVPELSKQIEVYEKAVAKALMTAHAEIGGGTTGSFAARKEASADTRVLHNYLARVLVARPLEKLLRKAIEANFPEDAARGHIFTPRIIARESDSRALEGNAAEIATLTAAGHLPQHEDITRVLLERNGLPVDVIEKIKEERASKGAPVATLAPGEAVLQARLANQSGLLHMEQASADWARSILGMPAWTQEAKDAWLASQKGGADLPPTGEE